MSDCIYCNTHVYKRLSKCFCRDRTILTCEWEFTGLKRPTAVLDGQIPSASFASWRLSHGPLRTNTKSRLTGSLETEAFFPPPNDVARSCKVAQLPGNEQHFQEVNSWQSAALAIRFKLPGNFVTTWLRLGSPSSHYGSSDSVPCAAGLVIGGRLRVHGKT